MLSRKIKDIYNQLQNGLDPFFLNVVWNTADDPMREFIFEK